MLVASRSVHLFERYRVPYRASEAGGTGPLRIGRSAGDGPELISVPPAPGTPAAFHRTFDLPLYAALADEAAVAAAERTAGRRFVDETPIVDGSGVRRAAIRRADDGSVLLPFDVDRPLDALLAEEYLGSNAGRRTQSVARSVYYRVRPLLPRGVQLALRRRFRAVQDRAAFPAWPSEPALHGLEAALLGLVEEIAGEPLPWIDRWPTPHEWAAVLTHDVEHQAGYDHVDAVREVERRHGLRSAWYFVPERDYAVEESLLDRLRADGCEIGVHGLRHDGRDLTQGVFEKRLAAMQAYGERWRACGFRAPATHRDRELIPMLGFEHDSSWSDVARYEPQPGGCCSWAPFFVGDTVELPITLPMDHTLFELLRAPADTAWLEKSGAISADGGMALALTHPDYLLESERLEQYERLVARIAGDPSAWPALPGQVASWWRARAATSLVRSDGGWEATGPASRDARIRAGAPRLVARS